MSRSVVIGLISLLAIAAAIALTVGYYVMSHAAGATDAATAQKLETLREMHSASSSLSADEQLNVLSNMHE